MLSTQIKIHKNHYIITKNKQEYSVPKNAQSSQIMNLLYPLIEKSQNYLEQIEPLLSIQYQHSIQQIILLQNLIHDLSFCEMEDQIVALEESLQLAIEWNYFLQDIYTLLDNNEYRQSKNL